MVSSAADEAALGGESPGAKIVGVWVDAAHIPNRTCTELCGEVGGGHRPIDELNEGAGGGAGEAGGDEAGSVKPAGGVTVSR